MMSTLKFDNTQKILNTYIEEYRKKYNKSEGMNTLSLFRNELDKEYGHYYKVRRSLIGILQLNDFGTVEKYVIRNQVQNLVISSSTFWLGHCLLALVYWMCDDKEFAAIL